MIKVQRLLKLTHAKLDQNLGDFPQQCLNVEKNYHLFMHFHHLFLLVESQFLIVEIIINTNKNLIGISTILKSVGTLQHITHRVSVILLRVLQTRHQRVFAAVTSLDLIITQIFRTIWLILSHLRQN